MIRVELTDWNSCSIELSGIRSRVFIEEQGVPKELEWDGLDENAMHAIARNEQQAVGTARMLSDGHIGRMAVLAEYRRQGIGSRLLTLLVDTAHSQGMRRVYLHAQISAVGFYKKHGFNVISSEFMDAGIPHVTMENI